MAFLIDTAFDSGLSYIDTNGTRIDICYGTEPTNYTQATSTQSCGNDTVNTGAPTDGATDGRRVIVPAITAGSVTDTQTAAWWALSDGASVLIATGPLSASQAVTNGNTFTLDAISITFRDVTAV
mgnify:CR=1 FL=1